MCSLLAALCDPPDNMRTESPYHIYWIDEKSEKKLNNS